MIRALLFMIKVGLLVALLVWIAERPGTVTIDWMDYKLTLQMGVFLTIALFTLLIAIFIYGLIKGVADFPKSFRRYREYMRKEKGYRALTLGLTAVAAGDARIAGYQAHRAAKFLPKDTGLPVLLKAQAARMQGREEEAREHFALLLENKDAAFLGVRGLLQSALDLKDYPMAMELAREALRLHPKQPWILRVVYDLEIKAHDWQAARATLLRAEKAGAIDKQKARRDRIAMLVAEADKALEEQSRELALTKLQKAQRLDPSFTPVATRLAKLYIQKAHRRKAVSVIERAWKVMPHPELVPVWDLAQPKNKKKKAHDPMARLKWFRKLLAINAQSPESHLAVARAAMDDGLWGEARKHLKQAEEIEPSARLYHMLVELEERSTQNEEAIENWLGLAAEAPHSKHWVCSETGRLYSEWSPIAEPHGSFNTIIWGDADQSSAAFLTAANDSADTLLEVPKA